MKKKEQTINNPYNLIDKDLIATKTKVPVTRGCTKKVCYCTGQCYDVIGFRDKLPTEL